MKRTVIVMLTGYCLGVNSIFSKEIDQIGCPIEFSGIKSEWPSNSVYCAYTKITVRPQRPQENLTYKRYVVDKAGANPSVLSGGTSDYIEPVVQYHIRCTGTNSVEYLRAIELYVDSDNEEVQKTCEVLGLKEMSFTEAIAVAPDQIWKGQEHNYLRMAAISDKYKHLEAIFYYHMQSLVSVLVVSQEVIEENVFTVSPEKGLIYPRNRVLDLSGLQMGATRNFNPISDFNNWIDNQKINEKTREALRRFAERCRKDQESYDKMSRLGILFSETSTIFKLPGSWRYCTYVSDNHGIQVETSLMHYIHEAIVKEHLHSVFFDRRKMNDISNIVFPGNIDLPFTVQACRDKLRIDFEIETFGGKYKFIGCSGNLCLLYKDEILQYASLYVAGHANKKALWDILGRAQEIVVEQNGHQYIKWRL